MLRHARLISEHISCSRFASTLSRHPRVDTARRCIELDFAEGPSLKLPYAWLRDNCQCEACYSAPLKARKLLPINFKPRADVQDIEVFTAQTKDSCKSNEDLSKCLKVRWTDSHESVYNFRWLQRFSFNAETIKRRAAEHRLVEQRKWNVKSLTDYGGVARFAYDAVMKSNSELRKCLTKLVEFGFCVIRGVPCELGHVVKFCDRVAYVKQSHYGRTFTVETKEDLTSVAYTSEALGLHTDLPYYFEPPGIQLLHCIKEADQQGGLTSIADGFYCAEKLKQERDDYFQILSNTDVDFKDYGGDAVDRFWLLDSYPIIECKTDRKTNKTDVAVLRVNPGQRDVFLHCEPTQTQAFYDAMHYFYQMLHNSNNCYNFKLHAGEMMIFHNHRVVHGRTAYRGARLLEGCYLGWDDAKSRLRVLMKDYDRGMEK